MARRRLKDADAAARMYRLKSIVWGVYVGLFLGVPVGGFVLYVTGNVLLGVLVGPVLCGGGVAVGSQFITARVAGLLERIHSPSGDSTPHPREYSYARSLVVRGRYEEALAAYELHAIEHPEDPAPYFAAARLCRDHLERAEDAIAWLRRARADARMTDGQELLAMQEIVELYVRKLRTPRKAIPELAMLADRFPDTPAGEAARQELAEMRDLLAREHEGFEPFTEQFLKKVGRTRLSQAAGLTRGEIERQVISEALRECQGDRGLAAKQLGVPLEKLEETMRELGMT